MTTANRPRVGSRDSSPAALDYWRGQVWPRRHRLLGDPGLWVSLLGALIVTFAVGHLPARLLRIDDVAAAIMDYTAIGLGACVTALVLAIGLAPEKRTRTWSTTYADGYDFSAYSELIFVLSWAATAQLAATVVAWVAKLVGADIALMPRDARCTHVVLFFAAAGLVIYALWHLFTVISTLSMLGAVTVREAQKEASEEGASSDR